MTGREESMRRHPSNRARIEWLIADAQHQQSVDWLYRLIGEADEFMGGPVPESAEVAEERMNREACDLGSSNAPPRTAPVHPVVEVARAVVAGLTVYGVIFAALAGPSIAEGWIA